MIKSITLNGRKYLSNNATKINYWIIQTKLPLFTGPLLGLRQILTVGISLKFMANAICFMLKPP